MEQFQGSERLILQTIIRARSTNLSPSRLTRLFLTSCTLSPASPARA